MPEIFDQNHELEGALLSKNSHLFTLTPRLGLYLNKVFYPDRAEYFAILNF